MTIRKNQSHQYTRREAVGLLGTAAGATLLAGSTGVLPVRNSVS